MDSFQGVAGEGDLVPEGQAEVERDSHQGQVPSGCNMGAREECNAM